jgi:hypothetical protein
MEVQQNAPFPSEYAGLTFEKVWAMFQETDKKFRETDRKIKETNEEINEQIWEQIRENSKLLQNNQKMMSDLGRKFGTIIEHMFIPNLKEKFNALGYYFEKSSPNVLIGSKKHNIYMEIDVFLENGDCALAVEVKTQANNNDVQEHIERMEKLRRYFDLHNDKRKLYGAIAAAIIPGNVYDFALKQGFYVIEQSGDNVTIKEPSGSPRA